MPFHELALLPPAERAGKKAFIWTLAADRKLKRLQVGNEMIVLADDRLMFWHQLKELAGLDVPESVHDTLSGEMEDEFERKLEALKQEYEAKLVSLKATYPRAIARQMAESLIKMGNGQMTVADLLTRAESTRGLEPIGPMDGVGFGGGGVAAPAKAPAADKAPSGENNTAPAPAQAGVAVAEPEAEEADGFAMEAYIETARCTSCNDCTNLNSRMFAYDENKQAYIKDVHAGTSAQLVQAAEKCPAGIIHPGDPTNPKEKDLEKWVKRAEPFN